MNAYAIFIVVALGFRFLVELVADLLNLRSLRDPVPPALVGLHDPDAYDRSQAYTRAATRFRILTRTVDLALLVGFWFAGGFGLADRLAGSVNLGPVGTGLLFLGALALARGLLSIPFDAYHTFGIEARFGFNRTTLRTFVLDGLKGALLAAVLGGACVGGVIALFTYAGSAAWLLAWAVVTGFLLLIQVIAPIWILPLFFRFTPLEAGDLRDAVREYAVRVGFPIRDVHVVDGSRRSTRGNAVFTGLGRSRRVAVFDTLLDQLSAPELVSVVAHEVGHYRKRHILQRTAFTIAQVGLGFWLLAVFLPDPALHAALLVDEPSIHVGLVAFSFLYAPLGMMLSLVMRVISRRHEYEADAFAATTSGARTAIGTALRKLARSNLANLTPHPFYVWLHHDHPPLRARLEAIDRIGADGTASE